MGNIITHFYPPDAMPFLLWGTLKLVLSCPSALVKRGRPGIFPVAPSFATVPHSSPLPLSGVNMLAKKLSWKQGWLASTNLLTMIAFLLIGRTY